MQHEELIIKNAENRILTLQSWAPNPDETLHGVFCFVHGIGEHLGRYTHWAEKFVDKGFVFFGLDLCCSGKSEGKQGFFYSYDSLMDDINLFIKEAEIKFPGMPLYLYGHSMGGNIILNYGLRKKSTIKALIATAPWLILKNNPSKIFLTVVRIFSKVAPNLIIDTSSSVSPEIISRDKDVVEKYIQDPLVHNKVSLKMAISLNDAAIYAMENAAKLDIPLLLMHGSADQITDPEGSRQFYEVNTHKFTLKIWDGLYHEVHNEPEKEEVFEFLINWVKKLNS